MIAGLVAFWSNCSSITIPSTWKMGMNERYKHIMWMRCDRYCTNVIMVHVACTNMDESVVCRNVINQIFYYGHWLCKITFHALVSHWHLYTFCPFLINLYIVDIMSWWGPAEMHYYSSLSGQTVSFSEEAWGQLCLQGFMNDTPLWVTSFRGSSTGFDTASVYRREIEWVCLWCESPEKTMAETSGGRPSISVKYCLAVMWRALGSGLQWP